MGDRGEMSDRGDIALNCGEENSGFSACSELGAGCVTCNSPLSLTKNIISEKIIKVNNADSAFIFLIILSICRNGQSGQGSHGGELCKCINEKM